MGEYIIKALEKIREELFGDLKVIQKDIDDYTKPLSDTNYDIDERLTGRLSTKSLQNNYKRKLQIENELQEIEEYFYYNKR